MRHPSPTDLGDRLADLIRADFDATFRMLFRPHGPTETERLFVATTGMPHPFANFGFTTGVAGPALVKEGIRSLCEDAFPSAFLSMHALPAESVAVLEENGFVHGESMPLMAVDLAELVVPDVPEGCVIERAGADLHDDWVDAMSTGYELPRDLVDPMGPRHFGSGEVAVEFHVVRRRGEPVASSMFTVRDGVVGVYCIATHPSHRGAGIGGWATAAPLVRFREAGHRTAILQASEMGAPIYRRLGFRDHGEMPLYVRIPS